MILSYRAQLFFLKKAIDPLEDPDVAIERPPHKSGSGIGLYVKRFLILKFFTVTQEILHTESTLPRGGLHFPDRE
jgi:hypothetical protein